MKRYEKYKDSGIAWIGEIPEGWEVKRLKNVCTGFSNGTAAEQLSAETTQYKVTRIETISTGEINCNKVGYVFNTKELQRFKLKKNDILISNINSFRMVGNCAMFDGGCDLYHGMNLIKISPLPIVVPRLLLNYLKTDLFSNQMQRACKPAINQVSVPSSVIKQMFIVLAPVAEQEVIAEFLDRKCGEIDEAVALQETMIGELAAYKQSVITEAVTRGLNPDAPLRDSGIEWIGSIPTHWEVKKTTQLFGKIGSGTTPKSSNEGYYVQDGINWLQTGDLTDGLISETSKKISQEAYESHSLRIYPKGSLVIALYGATIGKLGLLEIETTTNQACCVMCKYPNYNSKYGFYSLIAARKYILTLAYGGGQPNISQETIKGIRLFVPPLQEQQAIADHLDHKCEEIDQLIAIKREKIEQLKEYKKSVIFEYVTGKKRVK